MTNTMLGSGSESVVSLRAAAKALVDGVRRYGATSIGGTLWEELATVESTLAANDDALNSAFDRGVAFERVQSDALRARLRDAYSRGDAAIAKVAAAHKTLAACLRPETQTGSLEGDAARLVKAVHDAGNQILRVVQPSDGRCILERDLTVVVDELLKLREAIGLLITLHPGMEMRADDPVGWARDIVDRVRLDRAFAEMEGRAIFDIGRALEGVEFGGCNSIESTVRAAREVLPTIVKLRGELEKARADLMQSPSGTCWLIENPNRHAWYGGGCNGHGRWVSAIEAIRFARKEDAEAMRGMLALYGWFADADPKKFKVTEHGFYEPRLVKVPIGAASGDVLGDAKVVNSCADTKPLDEVYRNATGGLVDSAIKAVQAKDGIGRDPATGWTFDQFRRELAIARTTAQGNASMLGAALASKGGK